MRIILGLILFLLINFVAFTQCPNDICQNAIVLDLCTTYDLSTNCTTDWSNGNINLFGTGITGGCGYQWFQFDNDQWFYFSLDEYTQITIDLNTNYAAPLNSNSCPLFNNGTNQGVVLLLWTGDSCDGMFPVLNTWNASWCNGLYVIPECPLFPNQCNTQCANNSNLPSNIDPTHPAYITTAYWNSFCCFNWSTSCQTFYQTRLLQYNLSFQNWIVQQTGQPAEGFIGTTNPQDYLITTFLPPGNYWIQIDPISCNPNTGGYVSEGTGTINVCNTFFLNLNEDEKEEEEEKELTIPSRYKKLIHPQFGLLIYDTHKQKYYDLRMREIILQ